MFQATFEAHYVLGWQPAFHAVHTAPSSVEFFQGADVALEDSAHDFLAKFRFVVRGHDHAITFLLSPNGGSGKAEKVGRNGNR